MVLCVILGIDLIWNPLNLFGAACALVLGAGFFTTLSMTIAGVVLSRERLMGVGQMITMPLFFASNALYPIEVMPAYVAVLAMFNPLSYMVDGLRSLMIVGQTSHYGVGIDFLVLTVVGLALVVLAAKMYPRVVQ
jgi:ABC-2 type transport system permease protein